MRCKVWLCGNKYRQTVNKQGEQIHLSLFFTPAPEDPADEAWEPFKPGSGFTHGRLFGIELEIKEMENEFPNGKTTLKRKLSAPPLALQLRLRL